MLWKSSMQHSKTNFPIYILMGHIIAKYFFSENAIFSFWPWLNATLLLGESNHWKHSTQKYLFPHFPICGRLDNGPSPELSESVNMSFYVVKAFFHCIRLWMLNCEIIWDYLNAHQEIRCQEEIEVQYKCGYIFPRAFRWFE